MLIGAAVGAVAGVLFSPAKGSTTRRKLYRRSEDFVDDIEDSISEFYDDVSKRYSSVVDEAHDIAEKSKKSVTDKINEIKK